MLTFSEEMLVLLLEDGRGTLAPIPRTNFECALPGAVLMGLAFANRIDTDLETLMVTDRTPTGNLMLDRTLGKIGAREETTDTRTWIKVLAADGADFLREQALVKFVQHGILDRRERRFVWTFNGRRFREAEREIKLRIGNMLLSDDIPDPRDVALIGLVDACDLLGDIIRDRNIDRLRPRVEQLRKMDLIGRELAGGISDIEHNVKMALSGTRTWKGVGHPPLPGHVAEQSSAFARQVPYRRLANAICGNC